MFDQSQAFPGNLLLLVALSTISQLHHASPGTKHSVRTEQEQTQENDIPSGAWSQIELIEDLHD